MHRLLVAAFTLLLFLALTPLESEGPMAIWVRALALVVAAGLALAFSGPRMKLSVVGALFMAVLVAALLSRNIIGASVITIVCIAMYVSAYVVASGIWSDGRLNRLMATALGSLIVIWVVSLALQLVIYGVFGAYYDPHAAVFPVSAQHASTALGVPRFGGLHLEPGSYAQWMCAACLLRSLLVGRLRDGICALGMLSLALTLSLWGLAALAAYLTALVVDVSRSPKRLALMAMVIATLVAALVFLATDTVEDYISARLDSGDESTLTKLEVLTVVIDRFSDWALVGQPLASTPCVNCVSPQDAGITLNGLFYFGLWFVGVLLLAGRGLLRGLGPAGLVSASPLLLAKYYVWDPVFALVTAVLLTIPRRRGPAPPSELADPAQRRA